ncbi:TBP-interacting protein TIP49 [Spironucleus salmonicida]|uniref:RuvB-like helicase n=1 Tax=Spironucleus salmonicida TaxID=348837 RepID=V6M489_9EUKA|nr:TBP-interacting protein TIP49 [Spironucleus salmonicida]|eukprot:EST48144.1 TBP-interacting protein TIP49 [Spironucleus salmonicida]
MTTPLSRIGAHSHVRGLGLSDDLSPESREGLVGQPRARRAAGIVQSLILENKLAGRALLISGRPGSGKTALAHALAQSLGSQVPFVGVSASEFFSLEVNQTEALTQAIRRAISVQIPEETDLIEGEVAMIRIDESANGNGEKVGKVILKTSDMESSFDIGPKMIEMLNKESVRVGDVISIDKMTGRITKLGRVMSSAQDFDVLAQQTKLLPAPTGELMKRRSVEHVVTLHDMDVINSRSQGFLALFSGETGEISNEVRDQVDQKVALWKEEGRATVTSGVLFIDECHILTMEVYSFLNRVLESEVSPVVIFATNRGYTKIRGTEYLSPFGIPIDLLDRLLIINTQELTMDDFKEILQRRADEEDVELDQKAVDFLAKIAQETSLRYSIQLLTTSKLISEKRGAKVVNYDHLSEAFNLFLDVKRSVDLLEKHGDEYMFHNNQGPIQTQSTQNSIKEEIKVEVKRGRGRQKAEVKIDEDE